MEESDQPHKTRPSGNTVEYVPSPPVHPGPFWVTSASNVEAGTPVLGAAGSVHCASIEEGKQRADRIARRSTRGKQLIAAHPGRVTTGILNPIECLKCPPPSAKFSGFRLFQAHGNNLRANLSRQKSYTQVLLSKCLRCLSASCKSAGRSAVKSRCDAGKQSKLAPLDENREHRRLCDDGMRNTA